VENEEIFNLTDSERDELDRRLEQYEQRPDEGVSWDELKQRLLETREHFPVAESDT
jgi:putative addiction module component (TIGR02574 family)